MEHALNVKLRFQEHMLRTGKQEKTSTEYTRYIDNLSDHAKRDIFSIRRPAELAPLVARYDSNGPDSNQGNVYNGGLRAAIKQYYAFLQYHAPPLNQILYGPPGTGKTHTTIDETLAILDPVFLETYRMDRLKLRARFQELELSNHVRFVTFHQSFSYEDFVEGLGAVPDPVTKQLTFPPKPGIFKLICDDAQVKEVLVDAPPTIEIGPDTTVWKMSLGNRAEENHIYEECIKDGRILLGWGNGRDFSGITSEGGISTLLGGPTQNGKPPSGLRAVDYMVRQMKPGDLVVAADGNSKFRAIGQVTGDYAHLPRAADTFAQSRSVRWLKVFDLSMECRAIMNNDFTMGALYPIGSHALDRTKLAKLLSSSGTEVLAQQGPRERVLIIDEINRGNISRIFGELITLIEPSKRSGASEALSVTLPYSKERFSVPDNLYLIGTMNTSDRSLSGLDIALRRRFVFKEMPPRPDLLANVNIHGVVIGRLLTVMNERIEALLDREHCLGHAYFLPLIEDDSLLRLGRIFERQIIPLLKEYFFEDWNRIRWVLNDHRKLLVNCFVVPTESSTAVLFGESFEGRVQEKNWMINEDAFDRVESYLGIIDSDAVPPLPSTPRVSAGSVTYEGYHIERFKSRAVVVKKDGVEQIAKPILRSLAAKLSVSCLNSMGNEYNTQQLGDKVITAALKAKS